MPGRRIPVNDGERIAALVASFDAFEKYSHERWHQLAQDLTPIVNLPRDIAKLEGRLRGEMNAATGSFERTVSDAIEKALAPVIEDIVALKADVEDLKGWRREQTGAKNLALAFLHSPVVAWIFAIAVAAWTYFKGPAR